MLTKQALESSLPLTELLDSKRIALAAITGTPLEALVNATRSDQNFVFKNVDGFQIQVADIEYIANAKDKTFNASPHDITMEEITEVAIKAVQGHIQFARNVVAPAIADLVAQTTQTLQNLSISGLTGMEVIVWNPPKPLLNAGLETSVRRFEEMPFFVPVLGMKLPSVDMNKMLELLKTGSGNLDKDITEWAAGKGEAFFMNLWGQVFQQIQLELNQRNAPNFRDIIEDRQNGWDNALAIYLLARRLAEEPLEGTEMNLKVYNELMIEFRNQAGARLCRALGEMEKMLKAKQMVRSSTERSVTVYAPVYRDWINAGGENEVLFGNLLSGSPLATVENINAQAAEMKTRWNHHATIVATAESNRRYDRTKEALFDNFQKTMREIKEGEEATVGNREIVINNFRTLLDDVRESELDNLWALCLKLVCRARFYKTDAERILAGIEQVQKQNPTVSPREAAAVSVIEYIAFWTASQFKPIAV